MTQSAAHQDEVEQHKLLDEIESMAIEKDGDLENDNRKQNEYVADHVCQISFGDPTVMTGWYVHVFGQVSDWCLLKHGHTTCHNRGVAK